MVEDMVETSCRIVERYLDIILPLGKFDLGFFWEDISFKNGPIVSLDFYLECGKGKVIIMENYDLEKCEPICTPLTDIIEEMTIPGIPGTICNYKVLQSCEECKSSDIMTQIDDIDFKTIAHWALNYLLRSPRPEIDYQPIFSCWPLSCPPVPSGWDPIVDGDTDCRMDWEFYYMRDICGVTEGKDTEKAFHQRIYNYLGEHNLSWTYIGCYDMDPSIEVTKSKGKIVNVWSTTKILKSLALSYERTHNPEDKKLARKVFEGLYSLATWSGRYAWFEGGMGPLGKDLKPVNSGWGVHPPPIIESLVCYWEATGDNDALTFATAFADGIVERIRPGNVVQINDDGTFTGHMHATLHAILGIGHLGIVIKNASYIEFCKRVYEFVITHGTGTGWIHEAVTPTPQSKFPSSEVCATSDMMSIVASLAQAEHFLPGQHFADYYDHLERYLRNYIAPAQFIMTPEFIEYYKTLHKDKPIEDVEKGLADLHKMEGGIIGGIGINDLTNDWLGDDRTSFAMQGCCAPEGMRAIHTVWENIVHIVESDTDKNKAVFVNMSFSYECSEVTVISYLPDEGRMTVISHISGNFYLRPPAWAPQGEATAWRNTKKTTIDWDGAYVKFMNVNAEEELTITYPFISYEQRVAIWPDSSKIATFYWLGNTVVNVNPQGTKFPLYIEKSRKLPPTPKILE
jgi:hypothetical protein